MDSQLKSPPERTAGGKVALDDGFTVDSNSTISRINATSLRSAAAESLRRELWIVAQAGDQTHRGYPLSSEDLTRLHEAVVHILHVLQVVSDD